MPTQTISHALGLHMHQPPGNLELLIETNPFEAEQIIRCYERAARYALRYPEEGRLHVGFSGILLEQLRDPRIVDRYRHILDIPEMLERYRQAESIELIGMGYYHPIFPLIPEADWEDQLLSGRQLMADTFGRAPAGFWPPEMAFTMAMVPALVRAGYRYVVVDGVHVRPEDGVHDLYRPYLACHEGACITVVPRDRDISNAQESGLNPAWFAAEARRKVAESPRPGDPRLVTTWSDGENGGWFRQLHEESGFFGYFFAPYLEHVRYGEYPVTPVALSEYLAAHPAEARARVETGAWNIGARSGEDFSQWAGSESQRRAVETVRELSRRYHALAAERARLPEGATRALARAHDLLLEAETSCFLFWGDAWIPQLYERTGPAAALLGEVEQALSTPPPRARAPVPPAPPVAPAASVPPEPPAAPAASVPPVLPVAPSPSVPPEPPAAPVAPAAPLLAVPPSAPVAPVASVPPMAPAASVPPEPSAASVPPETPVPPVRPVTPGRGGPGPQRPGAPGRRPRGRRR